MQKECLDTRGRIAKLLQDYMHARRAELPRSHTPDLLAELLTVVLVDPPYIDK
jgi:hypothetical protein